MRCGGITYMKYWIIPCNIIWCL